MIYRLGLLIALLSAQTVDITRYRVDPATYLFEDGRTTLRDYVVAQLRTQSTCCGTEEIYVQLRITPEGTLEGVRPMTGRNDCYRKSLIDILRPLRWKAESFQKTQELYYSFPLNLECKGTESDNVYKPIPAPLPPVASGTPAKEGAATSQPPKEEPVPPRPPEEKPAPPAATEDKPKPIPPTPSLPGQTGSKTPPEEAPAPEPKPTPPQKPAPSRPSRPEIADQPAQKGFQPGATPPTDPGKPRPPAIVGTLPNDTLPQPLKVEIPRAYQSTGEKRPPDNHLGSYTNTSGPRYSEPDYIYGPIAKALYLKKAYRDQSVCGLVHVLLEVAIDQEGRVRGYRILASNSSQVAQATPKVLQGLRYKPVPLPMVFYTEFKIDVDCQSDQRRQSLDTIPDYIATPDAKLIRPPTSKP